MKNTAPIKKFDGTETIDWFAESLNIHRLLSAMIGHEQIHIGQVIAIVMTIGIHIPDKIVNKMALDGLVDAWPLRMRNMEK